jgi:ABC-type branched-subunit amino acid transport system substrate-binding protein
MKRSSSLFILLLFSYALVAQQTTLNEREYSFKYKKGVQLYASQQYLEAKYEFLPLTVRKYTNTMVPYAHYYLALCSFKLNNYFESRTILRQLFERFPDWEKIDEAYYLYANAALSDNNIDEAMQYLNRIPNNALKKDIDNMEYAHFSKVSDQNQLKQLNKKYPNNAIIAQLLVDNIQKSKNASREDLEISDNLTNRFKLGDTDLPNKPRTKKMSNGTVDIALLLPFKITDFDANNINRSNQYIYDLYAGMKLAKEKLESEQIDINLFAFDIDREANPMQDLVSNKEFSQVDMVIGPLYPDPNKVAYAYAKTNDAFQVHPFSNNQQLVSREKTILLASPSYEVQAQKSLEFIKGEGGIRSVAIYYGNSRKDSTFAYIYRDKAMVNGFEVTTIKRYFSEKDIDLKKKPGHIFLSGSDDSFGSKVISSLDRKKVSSPIIAASASFDFEKTTLNTFNRDLYLIQLDYIDRDKDEVKNFRSAYYNQLNISPSYYSYLGYDMLLFYGRMLKSGKNNFRKNLNDIEYTQGYTLDGFDYTNNANENKIVPIIKYQDGKFVEVMR